MNKIPAETSHRPLRGRDEEVLALVLNLERLTGGHASVTVVRGAPGAGKSRLVDETALLARKRGIRVFRGGGDPDGHFVAFGSLLEAFLRGPDPLLDSNGIRSLAAIAEQRFWVLQELQDRLERAALRAPLLITVDDLQWCDPAALLAIRTLPERLAGHAIGWLIAARSDSGPPEVHSTLDRLHEAGAAELTLGPLSDHAVAAITNDVLAAAPDVDVLELAARAHGRPLVLVELLRGLLDEGSIAVENGTAHVTDQTIPARLRDLIGQRLERLSPAGREVVQVASVLGRRFTVGQLSTLLHQSPAALITPLREAIRADLLIEIDADLGFRHDLIRETIETELPVGMRRAVRRQAVDAILAGGGSVVEIAGMLAETATAGDDAAVTLLRQAAAEVAKASASSAADLSARALELSALDAAVRPDLVVETIMLLWQAGRSVDARSLADTALENLLEPAAEARVRLGLARLSSQYSFTDALLQCRTALELPGVAPGVLAQLWSVLVLNLTMSGDFRDVEAVMTATMEAAQAANDIPALCTATATESVMEFYRYHWHHAFELQAEAAGAAKRAGVVLSLWVPEACWTGFLWTSAGDPERALSEADQGIAQARQHGQGAAIRVWMMARARLLLDAGRLADAFAESEAVLAMIDELGTGNFTDVTVLYTMGRVALYRGDRDAIRRAEIDAQRMIDDHAGLVRHIGLWLAALVAGDRGDHDAVIALTATAERTFDQLGPSLASPDDPADLPIFVRLVLQTGATTRAQLAVELAERRAELNPEFPILAASATHARGLLNGNPQTLLDAVDLFADSPRLIPRASAAEDAGRAIADTQSDAAVQLLQTALDLYEQAGAERDIARVRRRLRPLGVRKRRPSTTAEANGIPGLTRSEQQVVGLVARGATNREAASQLFLSPHTIDTHLRHVYAKLGVSSRVELTRIVLTSPQT